MKAETKENKVTFGHLLIVLIGIIVPLIIWGTSVERSKDKVRTNSEDIRNLRFEYKDTKKTTNSKFDLIIEKLHGIELILKDKQDKL